MDRTDAGLPGDNRSPAGAGPAPAQAIRKVRVDALRAGMRVVDTGLSWIDNPYLYSQEGVIASMGQVQALVAEGYREAFIEDNGDFAAPQGDPALEQALAVSPAGPAAERSRVPHAEELARAQTIYADSLNFARSFIRDVRAGKPLDYEASAPLVANILDSVSRNPDTLVSLAKLRRYDEYTYTHCINVSVLAVAFGRSLGLPRETLQLLGIAGLFHDVGKALIPAGILNKPGRLTDEEFDVIKNHPLLGARLLDARRGVPALVVTAVREHHEKRDGSGYPAGARGDEISLPGAMIGVADVYDALTSKRAYKNTIAPNTAMRILFEMRGKDFARGLVERFIKCLGIYPVGSLVRLDSGEVAVVLESNPHSPLRPSVRIFLGEDMRPRPPLTVNLAAEGADTRNLSIAGALDHAALGIDPLRHML